MESSSRVYIAAVFGVDWVLRKGEYLIRHVVVPGKGGNLSCPAR